MHVWRRFALGYAVILAIVASLNYLPIPGLKDGQGRVLGVFALDKFDDFLHLASALWAAFAAYTSARASEVFLKAFGALYFLDGLLGLATGSGFLDLGIVIWGVQAMPFMLKLFANLPHLTLGAVALYAGFRLGHGGARA
jgi:hypothetical protein